RVMVGPVEAVEALVLDETRDPHPVVPGDALLPLDHETDPHARPSPATAPARSPAPPTSDAARGRMLRPRRLGLLAVRSCAPRARLLCERRPRNAQISLALIGQSTPPAR